jgi:hypothetical protein
MNYRERTRLLDQDAREWKGGYRHYDLVKEASIAVGVVTLLAVIFAVLFSSPDIRSLTMKSWSRANPNDFVATALSELDKTSGTATYGPPYNHTSGAAQHLWFIDLQTWLGVAHPINTSEDYVLAPLRAIPGQPALQTALSTYTAASVKQQTAWDDAYGNVLAKTSDTSAAIRSLNGSTFGPVPTMMTQLLNFAQAGGLDGDLLTNPQFYATDYTKTLMFLADGNYLSDVATAQHLQGEQWGMMNETGSFPGQSWLWLYTFWYQIKPFSTSANGDILVMAVMGLLSVLFVLVPFIPGLRDIPRKIPIYKIIWREHYGK